MIQANTSQIKLDNCDLIIRPELTAPQFLAADIPLSKTQSSKETGWTTCRFTNVIDGMKADFIICFRWEKLCLLIWRPTTGASGDSWTAMAAKVQKQYLDAWLAKVIGMPSPYEYDWGSISSAEDIHTGDFLITVEYKYGLLDRGITDFKSYFEERRKYRAQSG